MVRVGRRAAATLLAGACLVCSPAVFTTTPADLEFVTAPAAAVPVLQGPVRAVPPLTPLVVPTAPSQWFLPSGRNQGTEGLAMFLANLALRDNAPLYVSETSRATGGSNSDHHVSRTDSWAVDVAVRGIQQPTAATRTAAARIASALGVPNWTGGDLTRTVNGYRFQVLWLVAGHYNHVHVGVRKVG